MKNVSLAMFHPKYRNVTLEGKCNTVSEFLYLEKHTIINVYSILLHNMKSETREYSEDYLFENYEKIREFKCDKIQHLSPLQLEPCTFVIDNCLTAVLYRCLK